MQAIGAVLTLKDQFSSGLKNATGGTQTFRSKMEGATGGMKTFEQQSGKVKSGLSSMTKGLIGAAAGYVGIKALTSAGKEWISAANKQIEAETKLEAVMRNTKGVTTEQIQGIKGYASELQNVGVIGDEVALSGVQQLATYQLQSDTLKKLMPGMNDLLAQQKGLNATQEDATNIGNMVGKVMAGQVGALSRAGINFNKAQEQVLKFGTEQQKAATLAEVLEQNVGGVNAALLDTDAGKMQQAKNAIGDLKEELGKKLLPVVGQVASATMKYMPQFQKITVGAMEGVMSGVGYLQDKFNTYMPQIKSVVGSVTGWIGEKFGWLAGETQFFGEFAGFYIGYAKNQIQVLGKVAKPAIDLLASSVKLGYEAFKFAFPGIQKVVTTAWNILEPILGAMGQAIGFVADKVGKVGSWLGGKNNAKQTATGTLKEQRYVNPGLVEGSFATGINRVPKDMVAQIHKDEAVIPAKHNPYNPSNQAKESNGFVINIPKIADTVIIRGEEDINTLTQKIMNSLMPQLKLAISNS